MTEYRYMKDGMLLASLIERPTYCDRGRYYCIIDIPVWRSDSDPWPRYYFFLPNAMTEIEEYLRFKQQSGGKIPDHVPDVTNGHWVQCTLDSQGDTVEEIPVQRGNCTCNVPNMPCEVHAGTKAVTVIKA